MRVVQRTYNHFILKIALLGMMFLCAQAALAQSNAKPKVEGRYASIIVDMDNQEIVHARKIDEARYPASLTKIMTLYLTFDALNQGKLRIDQKLPVSRYAAQQPATKLGLKAGSSILVRDAINAMIVRSSNDVAIVLAEAISGSELEFSRLMTHRARELGMMRTNFKNPHGLPNNEHISTARDMAKLAHALIRDHRTFYHLFSQKSFTFRGKTYKSTNKLLSDNIGVDGLKTGYTRASGYNLTISAERQGRRLIAIVLGGASGKSRDQHMRDLIQRGFDVILKTPAAAPPPVAIKPSPAIRPVNGVQPSTAILRLRDSNGNLQTVTRGVSLLARPGQTQWSLYLGEFTSPRDASGYVRGITGENTALASHIQILERGRQFQARLSGLPHKQANQICNNIRSQGQICKMIQHTIG